MASEGNGTGLNSVLYLQSECGAREKNPRIQLCNQKSKTIFIVFVIFQLLKSSDGEEGCLPGHETLRGVY